MADSFPPQLAITPSSTQISLPVAGIRVHGSAAVHFVRAEDLELQVGDWVLLDTTRRPDVGRVVVGPSQVRVNQRARDLEPFVRRLSESEVAHWRKLQAAAFSAVRAIDDLSREQRLSVKPISAWHSYDGSALTVDYAVPAGMPVPDTTEIQGFARQLSAEFQCRVELREVEADQDPAMLVGGKPVGGEQPLLCRSSEDERYQQQKSGMPRLGSIIDTPAGPGPVLAIDLRQGLVTIRLVGDNSQHVFASRDLGFGQTTGPDSMRKIEATGHSAADRAEMDGDTAERTQDELWSRRHLSGAEHGSTR